MSKVLPFRKKKAQHEAPKQTTISLDGCHFEKNGIGMLLGEDVKAELKDTKFIDNGVGIVAGELDERFLDLLKSASAAERFKYAQELNDIAKAENDMVRNKLISRSTLGKKLAHLASIATVSSWLQSIVKGVSKIDLDKLIQTIMGS